MLNPKHLGSACAPSLGAVMDCGPSRFRHSILIRPIQPRNSTVQCIFLAYFTPQMLPFPMPRLIPNKTSCRSSSPSTARHPSFQRFLFTLFQIPFAACPPAHIDFYFHDFHALAIPQCANPLFSHLCKPPGCHPKNSTASLGCAQRLSRKSISFIPLRPLAASWLSFSSSCPLFSDTCSLLCQKQGWGGVREQRISE